DLVQQWNNNGRLFLYPYLSTGTGFNPAGNWIDSGNGFTPDLMALDINGDGKTDLVQQWNNNGRLFLYPYLSTGTGFNPAGNWIDSGNGFTPGLMALDINGDGKTDLVQQWNNNGRLFLYPYLPYSPIPDLLTSLTPALGAQTTITYKPLTDPAVHTRENTAAYPVMDFQAPMYVVASHSASNGIGGMNTTSYSYAGAKLHQTGRGFLGFRSVVATGPDGLKTTNYYHQGYPYTGLLQQADTQQPGGAWLRRTVNTWTAHNLGGGRYFPYVASSTDSAWELNGAALPTATTTSSYDLLGNPTAVTSTASDGHRTSTANIYSNDTSTWLLGQLTQAQVTRTLPGGQSQTRTSTFAYDGAGRLVREVIEPNTVFTLTTDYGYDAYGHRNRATVSGADIATRTTATDYLTSPSDPYPQIRTTNALGHTEVQTLDARYGAPASLTGPNGLTTAWAYDGFGRKVQENRADGTATTWSLAWCPSATCPWNARYLATSQSSGSAPLSVYYDILGREVRSHTQGFNGQAVYKDTQYDILGRLQYASQPYFAGGAAYWGVISYDLLGRPVTETAPHGAVTRTSYQGLTTVVTNALNQTATRVKNSQGQLLQAIDTLGSLTRYSYDPFGNLIQTVDPKSNIATLTYDLRGRKRSMTDPDMGYWEYKYNALGELTSQMDAKAQTVTLTYDLLGRMIKRVEKEGISTWAYDTAPMGKGKLAQVIGPNGYKQTPVYDGLGRPVRVSTFIDSATVPYDMDTGYDAFGRVGSVAYPVANGSRFTLYNTYNPQGYLAEVKNAATGQSYWKADVMDATGRLLAETFGNNLSTVRTYNPASGALEAINTGATIQSLSYSYDTLGNLTRRADAINGVSETFAYDALNRLTGVSGPAPKTYAYDSIGNITSKSDIGTYTYGAKPHAVTATATAGVVNASYTYDANGNMTGGNGRYLMDYTSFNLPQGISKGDTQLNFGYGADHQRTIQVNRSTGFPSVTREITVYVNPRWDSGTHYEKTTRFLGGNIEHKHYIYAGNTPVALYTTGGSVPTVRYLHKDHLGSIDTITNETGNVVERLSYDAFGKRRQPNGQDAAINGAWTTHHGYTGHEHLDGLGLIHMNGRIYDPDLARFTQADPYIQNPANLQDLNRYSYVTNNPLKYTDPSGYRPFWKQKWFRETVKAAVAVVAAAYTGGLAASAYFSSAIAGTATVATANIGAAVAAASAQAVIVGGMAGGAVAGGIMGNGSLKGVVSGAATGMLFGAVGASGISGFSKVLVSGMVGGITTDAQGGKFEDGFKISGITSSMSWGYSAMVGYKADPLPGKSDPNHTTYDPEVYPAGPQGMDVSGFNAEGRCFFCQGGIGGRVINALPGGQAVSHLDDWFNNTANRYYPGLGDTQWLKGVTIPAAVVVGFPALLDGPMAVNLSVGRR
ncbi:MAG: VCBS repeat-containing protein, partial [Gammaproteobacteria bacterium]|nr:VCBS repeat-containing protein [Gammaproteobacteria bacterium]